MFKFLAKEGDLNIVVDKDVGGKISMFLKNIRIQDALDIAVLGNALAYTRKDGVINIMTDAKYEMIYGVKFDDRRRVRVVRLKYAKPEIVLSILEKVKSKIGSVVIDQGTGTVMLMDTPIKLDKLEQAIKMVDLPMDIKMIPLKYADTEAIVSNISGFLTPNIGSVLVDKQSRTLIVTDFVRKLHQVEKIVKSLDKKRDGNQSSTWNRC